MKNVPIVFLLALSVAACNKSTGPGASPNVMSAPKLPDAVQQKLQQYAGPTATDCGRLDVSATQDQSKAASDCAMQANQGKHPFYVAYDMPGMTVGVAGNSEGKLFTVQSQESGSSANLTTEDCPSQLRIATSGRITCFAPGDMGSMGSGHGTGPLGVANPHAKASDKP